MRKAMPAPMRLFLIWCLALLLPLQGLAASAGLHCVAMAVVPADTDTQTVAAAHPCHGTAETAGQTEGHHAAVATSNHAPSPATADELAAAGHTCSACAACCVAAALPSHSRWTAATVLAEAMPVLLLPHCAGITSAGLDRPPKTFIV